jgi:hypothetical protein
MLINIFSENLKNIIQNLTGNSMYYNHLLNTSINYDINYYYSHLGIDGILKSDSVDWFAQSKFSNNIINNDIIQLMLKYGSYKIIEYSIKYKILNYEEIFKISDTIKLCEAQSKYLMHIQDKHSPTRIEYHYLTPEEIQHCLDIQQLEKLEKYTVELNVKYSIYNDIYRFWINRYDEFWGYYFNFVNTVIVFDKLFMQYDNLQKIVKYLFERKLVKSLIKLDTIMSHHEIQFIQITWNNFKAHFRITMLKEINNSYCIFHDLMIMKQSDREYIINIYLCDKSFWKCAFDKFNNIHTSLSYLNTQDFIWIYENEFFPKRNDLFLLGLAVAIDNYNTQMFNTLTNYLLHHQLITTNEIISLIEAMLSPIYLILSKGNNLRYKGDLQQQHNYLDNFKSSLMTSLVN